MKGEQKMNLNLNFIKRNSMQVYNILSHYTRCTFAQLEQLCNMASTDLQLCNMASTDLCLALAQLMRENKIEQYADRQAVYYRPLLIPARQRT